MNALAYTAYGGEILKVSATMYRGDGKIKVTGSVGKIMEESVSVAMSYIKANADNFNIDYNLFLNNDFHIHKRGLVLRMGQVLVLQLQHL